MTTAERRTEERIVVRQVTHVQASWTERERGDEGDFTLQLILDQGAEEYVLRPDADDLVIILQLLQMSDGASFDTSRKVLMFRNLALT
jgi:predicted ATPase